MPPPSDLLLDRLAGCLMPLQGHTVLVTGPAAQDLAAALGVALGAASAEPRPLVVAYAWPMLTDVRLFFPTLVVDDYGAQHAGPAVHDWLEANTYSQPRAGVFGRWPDGQADQVFARDIDVEARPVALAALDPAQALQGERLALVVHAARVPDAVDALVTMSAGDIPERLARLLPSYWLNLAVVPPADPAARALLARLVAQRPRALRLGAAEWRAFVEPQG